MLLHRVNKASLLTFSSCVVLRSSSFRPSHQSQLRNHALRRRDQARGRRSRVPPRWISPTSCHKLAHLRVGSCSFFLYCCHGHNLALLETAAACFQVMWATKVLIEARLRRHNLGTFLGGPGAMLTHVGSGATFSYRAFSCRARFSIAAVTFSVVLGLQRARRGLKHFFAEGPSLN
jgi:hypothetical protein